MVAFPGTGAFENQCIVLVVEPDTARTTGDLHPFSHLAGALYLVLGGGHRAKYCLETLDRVGPVLATCEILARFHWQMLLPDMEAFCSFKSCC